MATPSSPTRFVALDIHRKYLVVGAVDSHQQVVLPPRRFGFEAFSAWASTHLTSSDAVVLEATSNAWLFYDQLEALLVPAVWVPPVPVRELRALVNHRKRLVTQRTQVRNRLQAVLHRHNL